MRDRVVGGDVRLTLGLQYTVRFDGLEERVDPEAGAAEPGEDLAQRVPGEDRLFLRPDRLRLRGEVATLDIDTPATESQPNDPRTQSPSLGDISARVTGGKVKGPGIMPVVVPVLNSRDGDYTRWRASNVRPQKQFGYVMVVATIPLGAI